MKIKNFFIVATLCSLLNPGSVNTQNTSDLVIKGKSKLEKVILENLDDAKVDSFVVYYSRFPDGPEGEALFITSALGDSISYASLKLHIPKAPRTWRTLYGLLGPELNKDYSDISGKGVKQYRLNENTYPLADTTTTLIQFWTDLVKSIPERPIISAHNSEKYDGVVRDVKVKGNSRDEEFYDLDVSYMGFHNDYLLVKFSPSNERIIDLSSVYMYVTKKGKLTLFEINMKRPLQDFTAFSMDYYRYLKENNKIYGEDITGANF